MKTSWTDVCICSSTLKINFKKLTNCWLHKLPVGLGQLCRCVYYVCVCFKLLVVDLLHCTCKPIAHVWVSDGHHGALLWICGKTQAQFSLQSQTTVVVGQQNTENAAQSNLFVQDMSVAHNQRHYHIMMKMK